MIKYKINNKEISELNEKIRYYKFLINSKKDIKILAKITKCEQRIIQIENEVKLKRKINSLSNKVKDLNKKILQQQKFKKNKDAVATQIQLENTKQELSKISNQYANLPKTKKNFIPDHSEKANLSSSLAIMRGSGLIYSPINSQAQRQTKGYKKVKTNKKKKKK